MSNQRIPIYHLERRPLRVKADSGFKSSPFAECYFLSLLYFPVSRGYHSKVREQKPLLAEHFDKANLLFEIQLQGQLINRQADFLTAHEETIDGYSQLLGPVLDRFSSSMK